MPFKGSSVKDLFEISKETDTAVAPAVADTLGRSSSRAELELADLKTALNRINPDYEAQQLSALASLVLEIET